MLLVSYAVPDGCTGRSPAIDAIPKADCPETERNLVTTDQRGVHRPQGPAFDIGAFEVESPDADGDGVLDTADECLDSDLRCTVVIDACDSSVPNAFNILGTNGCTIADLIGRLADSATRHGAFVSGVAHLTNNVKKTDLISGSEKGAIQSCAGSADVP
jgi:hypothetical protein